MKIKLALNILLFLLIALISGCSNSRNCMNCPLENKDLNGRWANSDFSEMTISIIEKPHKISKETLKGIIDFFDRYGIKVNIVKSDLKFPSGKINEKQARSDMVKYASKVNHPALVIAKVDQTCRDDGRPYKRFGAISASYRLDNFEPPKISTIILDESLLLNFAEKSVVLHEIGHNFGIPSRKCHTIKNSSHCTNLRCIMTSGPGSTGIFELIQIALSNILTFGVPSDFCKECRAELDHALQKKNRE